MVTGTPWRDNWVIKWAVLGPGPGPGLGPGPGPGLGLGLGLAPRRPGANPALFATYSG